MKNILENQDELYDVDDDGQASEEVILYSIQLTYAAAMKSPDATEHLLAEDVEKLKLQAARTWRDPKPGELSRSDKIIPIVCIYSKKRNGTFKCR